MLLAFLSCRFDAVSIASFVVVDWIDAVGSVRRALLTLRHSGQKPTGACVYPMLIAAENSWPGVDHGSQISPGNGRSPPAGWFRKRRRRHHVRELAIPAVGALNAATRRSFPTVVSEGLRSLGRWRLSRPARRLAFAAPRAQNTGGSCRRSPELTAEPLPDCPGLSGKPA